MPLFLDSRHEPLSIDRTSRLLVTLALGVFVDVRFDAHFGLNSDIPRCRKWAKRGHRLIQLPRRPAQAPRAEYPIRAP
jgi:hypothetical protein